MDELKHTEKKNTDKKEPDWFITVTTVQILMCLVVGAAVFFISTSNGENAQKLKNDYSSLMSMTIEASDAKQVFSSLKSKLLYNDKKTDALFEEDLYDISYSEPSDSVSEVEHEEETSNNESQEESSNEDTTAVENQTQEAKAVMASGGKDIELFSAKENTSFSPVATTCPIVRPVDGGWYSSYFGYRINPITNEKSFHTGLDIAVAHGSNIHAAYSGKVRLVGEDDHSGKYILLSHSDGFETFYCHCSEIVAEEGANIRSGETIAKVGSTGWSTGPHLHFEIRKDGERLDPLRILENDS